MKHENNIQNDQYSVEQIAPDTWRIDEGGMANAYLAAGDEKALLIDSGNGTGNIRKIAEELTPLPVICAATHNHPDHVGGFGWYPQYTVMKPDTAILYRFMSLSWFTRILGAKNGIHVDLPKKPYHPKLIAAENGQVFRLGNRDVRMIAVPGHTRGSACLVDDKERLVFTGDEVNPSLWMHLPGCTTLEEWLPGAETVADFVRNGYRAYCGHMDGLQSREQIEQTIVYGRELIAMARDGQITGKEIIYPDSVRIPQILCRGDRILKRSALTKRKELPDRKSCS